MKNSTLNILKQQSKKQRTNYRNRVNAVAVNRSTPASTIQNVLVGEEQKVQEKQDFLNRLTRMAYAHPTKDVKVDTEKLLALDGGVEQSRAVLHSVVSDIDNYPFLTLELLTREAVKMKLAQFIVSYFGLNKSDAEELVKRIQPPKQREVVIPYGLKQTEHNSSG